MGPSLAITHHVCEFLSSLCFVLSVVFILAEAKKANLKPLSYRHDTIAIFLMLKVAAHSRVIAHPLQNPLVSFFGRLPEEAVRLSFKDFVLGVGNAFGEDLSLRHMIASHYVIVSDHDQRRHGDVA